MKRTFTFLVALLPAGALPAQSTCSIAHQPDVLVCYEIGCNTMASASFTSICPPPYSYLWLPGGMTTQTVSGLCPGTYTVIASDQCGCTASDTFTVIQNPQLLLGTSFNPASCPTCPDGTATANASGGTPPFFYQWNTNPVQTTPTATGLLPGNYTATVVDANGCMASDTVAVNFTTGIPDPVQELVFALQQNPVHGQALFMLQLPGKGAGLVSFTDLLGARCGSVNVSPQQQQLVYDVGNFAPGVYFCTLASGGVSKTIRMLVR